MIYKHSNLDKRLTKKIFFFFYYEKKNFFYYIFYLLYKKISFTYFFKASIKELKRKIFLFL